jgi:hypothetical protein
LGDRNFFIEMVGFDKRLKMGVGWRNYHFNIEQMAVLFQNMLNQ